MTHWLLRKQSNISKIIQSYLLTIFKLIFTKSFLYTKQVSQIKKNNKRRKLNKINKILNKKENKYLLILLFFFFKLGFINDFKKIIIDFQINRCEFLMNLFAFLLLTKIYFQLNVKTFLD